MVGAPATIQARIASLSAVNNGPAGESGGGISFLLTRSQSSDSSGDEGTTISRLRAIRARSVTYPNRPLGFGKSGPWQPAHLLEKTASTSEARSRSGSAAGIKLGIPNVAIIVLQIVTMVRIMGSPLDFT
jgi:hypothetical protein